MLGRACFHEIIADIFALRFEILHAQLCSEHYETHSIKILKLGAICQTFLILCCPQRGFSFALCLFFSTHWDGCEINKKSKDIVAERDAENKGEKNQCL